MGTSRMAKVTGTFLIVALVVASVPLLAGCGAGQEKGGLSGSLTIAGSTALQPLVDEAATQFMSENQGVQITVNAGGSGAGLSQVSEGSVDIGNSDIFAEEKSGIDAASLVDTKVCVVGFAIVANPAVGVDNLSKQQLIDIFTGKITNWKEVGGADQAVVVINRGAGSGTRATFKKWALDGNEEIESMTVDSSGDVRTTVAGTPGAVSYLALSYVDSTVKALSLDGVAPTVANITSGTYPIWSYEHMYTKGAPSEIEKAFLDYMLSSDVQGSLVQELGYIPIADMKVTR